MIVTAPRDLSALGATVIEITPADLQAQHAQTVADALEFFPGLDVRVGDSGQSYLRLRGLRQRETLVLLDGIPLGVPYDGNADLSQIPLDAVEMIRVVAGAPSALYGPDGMGGVVSIITKSAGGTPSLSSASEVGQSDRRLYSLSLAGPHRDGGYLIAARRTDTAGFRLSDDFAPTAVEDGGLRENAWHHADDVLVKVQSPPRAGGRGAFLAGRLNGEFGVPPDVGDPAARYQRYDRYDRWLWGGWWERPTGHRGTFKGNLYHVRYDVLDHTFDDASMSSQIQSGSGTVDADDRTTGATLGWRRDGARDTFKVGATLRFDNRAQHGFTVKRSGPVPLDDHFATSTYSANAEYERPLSSATGLVVGLSWARFHQRDLGGAPGAGDRSIWLPQAALVHRPSPSVTWRMAVSKKTRFPNLRELGDAQSGNPDVRPQTSRNVEIGFQRTRARDHFEIVAFRSRLRDLISRRGSGQPYENIDAARVSGLEISHQRRLSSHLMARLAYAYLRTRDLSPNPELPVLQYRPNHVWIADLRWRPSSEWRASLVGKYVTSQIYYDRRAALAGKISPYLVAKCRLGRAIPGLGEVYLAIDNLFDRDYQESAGQPQPGRTIWLGFSRGTSQ